MPQGVRCHGEVAARLGLAAAKWGKRSHDNGVGVCTTPWGVVPVVPSCELDVAGAHLRELAVPPSGPACLQRAGRGLGNEGRHSQGCKTRPRNRVAPVCAGRRVAAGTEPSGSKGLQRPCLRGSCGFGRSAATTVVVSVALSKIILVNGFALLKAEFVCLVCLRNPVGESCVKVSSAAGQSSVC